MIKNFELLLKYLTTILEYWMRLDVYVSLHTFYSYIVSKIKCPILPHITLPLSIVVTCAVRPPVRLSVRPFTSRALELKVLYLS